MQQFMYSSAMNAVIKLLLSQRNKINCLKEGGRVERLPEKVVTDAMAQVLGFSGDNFCQCIRLREVTFVMHKVFGDFLNEKCLTFY